MKQPVDIQEIASGLRICSTITDRFKTGQISINLAVPHTKDDAAINAVLIYLLHRSSAKYPNMTNLQQKLDKLYGASLSASVTKIGEAQVLRLAIRAIDDRFALQGESITSNCTHLLCEMLFEPKIVDGSFLAHDVGQEKRLLIERIESEMNDKRVYANSRCEEIMCRKEAYGVSRHGTAEDVSAVTPHELYKAWQTLLQTARMQVNIVGSAGGAEVKELVLSYMKNIDRSTLADIQTELIPVATQTSEYTEELPVAQGKLVLGCRVDYSKNNRASFQIMADVFGGGPYSRLFMNVREKLSLAYYCSAGLNRAKGIMLIQSGIEVKNRKKAQDEILRQLDIMKNGEFTDTDLDSSKKALMDNLQGFGDSPSDFDMWYFMQMLDDTIETPHGLAEKIASVTRDDVVMCANKVTVDTIYMLKGTQEGDVE